MLINGAQYTEKHQAEHLYDWHDFINNNDVITLHNEFFYSGISTILL
jgi:hypothetical protein